MHICIDNLKLFSSFSTIATTIDLGGLRAAMNIVYKLGYHLFTIYVQLFMSPIIQSLKILFEIWNKDN
jgi:hypothetical protein